VAAGAFQVTLPVKEPYIPAKKTNIPAKRTLSSSRKILCQKARRERDIGACMQKSERHLCVHSWIPMKATET